MGLPASRGRCGRWVGASQRGVMVFTPRQRARHIEEKRPAGGPRRLSTSTPSIPRRPGEHQAQRRRRGFRTARSGRNKTPASSARSPQPAGGAPGRDRPRSPSTARRLPRRRPAPAPPPTADRAATPARPRPGAHNRHRPPPHAGACNPCGGAINTDQRPSSRIAFSTGSSKAHSPMPTSSASNSVSAPRGQPPPGSSSLERWKATGQGRHPRPPAGRARHPGEQGCLREKARRSWHTGNAQNHRLRRRNPAEAVAHSPGSRLAPG